MNNKLDYIAIDFETANDYKNSACSVDLVRFIDGKETDACSSLIHPAKMYFNPIFTAEIHHISYNDVRDKPYFPEVWDTIVLPFIHKTPDIPLVAHNGTRFDIPLIRDCCLSYGMDLPFLEYFDSLRVAQCSWPEFDNHRLTTIGEHFGIDYLAHDALEDSRTCGEIIRLAAEKHGVKSVEDLLKVCRLSIKSL